MKRKVCIFTGTRAEYGLLNPLMREILDEQDLELQIIVSGMHLSPEFGSTYKEIEKEGFEINEKVEILLSADTPTGICKSIGLGTISFGEALTRLIPDIAVVLGDRFEALAFAIAATVTQIPLAHIHGGEITEGVIDESFRHAITKMSHLHFTSTDVYRKRVIQLGENPNTVFNVGALGIDNIKNIRLLSREELEGKLGFKLNKYNLLITMHPVAFENSTSEKQIRNLLKVLDELADTNLIFTKANADTGGRIINSEIDEYVLRKGKEAIVFTSMGQRDYLSTMKYVDAVVGNSSSGIIEAPSFNIGTINIGDRQRGRLKADSVMDCEPTKDSIRKAFKKLYSISFQKKLKNIDNPYGCGNTAQRILEILKNICFNKLDILKKTFFDLDYTL